MRALTVHQPWASLIAHGKKQFETRSWKAPDKTIGEVIAIHSARKRNQRRPVTVILPSGIHVHYPEDYGAVIATAKLEACFQAEEVIDCATLSPDDENFDMRLLVIDHNNCEHWMDRQEAIWGHIEKGRWLWKLTEVILHPPIPVRGCQRLWNLPFGVGMQCLEDRLFPKPPVCMINRETHGKCTRTSSNDESGTC